MDENNVENKSSNHKDYAQLIAAQYESNRRLKIIKITDKIDDEYKKKYCFAIATGVCFAGLVAATAISNFDFDNAIQTEIQAINSFDALKEYLSSFTPAMWGTMIATAANFANYMRHNKNYKEANKEYSDMIAHEPVNYLDVVERQARNL